MKTSGNPPGALASLEAAAASRPRDTAVLMELAMAYLGTGRSEQAEKAFRAAARLLRDSPKPGLGIAASLAARGRYADAVSQLRKLVHTFPTSADAWFNLGNFLRRQRDFDEAARAYRRVLALRPGEEGACVNLGMVLTVQERFSEAELELRDFMAQHGESADLLCNLGQALRYARRYGDAEEALRRATALTPGHAGAQFNLALTLSQAGGAEVAERMLRTILGADPRNAEAHAHLGELLLGTGRYAEGWREYRWRDVHIERNSGQWTKHAPDSGPQSTDELRGRHVVVKGEQGLGDVLFFLRFTPDLLDVAASVTLDVDPRLRGIIGERAPFRWLPPDDGTPLELLAGSVPAAIGATGVVRAFALRAEPGPVKRGRELLEEWGPPPYIGVTWEAGTRLRDSKKPGAELYKRIDPEALAGMLAGIRGTVVSLQRNPSAEDLSRFRAALHRPAADIGEANKDLPLLLGVLSGLDEYLGVSNTNMHLLAGLGRRARVLVPLPPDWRWMRAGDESPWFPGFRVYRQARDLSWDAALAALRGDLLQRK
jgi:Flp pilus assembly protein TadD